MLYYIHNMETCKKKNQLYPTDEYKEVFLADFLCLSVWVYAAEADLSGRKK